MNEEYLVFLFMHVHRDAPTALDALQTDAESHRVGLWIRFDDMRADNIPLVGPKDSRTWFSGRLREGEYSQDTDRSREQQDAQKYEGVS